MARIRLVELHSDWMPPRAVPNLEEQEVLNHILAAMEKIESWGLAVNTQELTVAVHTLQGFVIAHMLHRIEPRIWSNWFTNKSDNGETAHGQ